MTRTEQKKALAALLEQPDLPDRLAEGVRGLLSWCESAANRSLSNRQEAWVKDALKAHGLDDPDDKPIPANSVPVGRPVETPAVLRNLPKSPAKKRIIDLDET